MIGKAAEKVINRAVQSAVEQGHEFFTLEHILISLLEDTQVSNALTECGANLEELKKEALAEISRAVPEAPKRDDGTREQPIATLGIQRLIQRALFHVQSSGKGEIGPLDLLVALYQAKDSYSLYLLQKQGVERLALLEYISHGGRKSDDEAQPDGETVGGEGASGGKAVDALATYTQNLNELARQGKIDPLVGRSKEIERMILTLSRRRKNNPILVGEAGVGKTALVEGLALRIVSGEVPDAIRAATVYSLDLGGMLAGARFRGDFEQRLKKVLKALQVEREKGREPVLFIDEIHTIVGAGAVSGGSLDAANLLKPYLSRGELRCIGSTTFAEYRSHFEKDHALARRFQKIDVNEPSQEEAIEILRGLKKPFEEHHSVHFQDAALRAAVELSAKHITDRFLPDKAVDVIDEAGARARLKNTDRSKPAEIGVDEIEETVSVIARIPPRSVNVSQKDRLKNLGRDLKLAIFGQDEAIEALVSSIRLARSGLRTGERPVGSFLLCGPTGVGKTELSKQLAHALGVPFLRFDMSEYGEKHTVSRLIGAPPGYVGFDQAGLLTDAILKQPHAVVLLDEIEKAHSDVWNILLQVMDHGFLTDNNGRKADFRNAILLMTSNVGSREMERRPIGVETASQAPHSRAAKEVERTFSPEFRNRLDATLYFNALGAASLAQVVTKQLAELESQLLARHVELEVEQDLRDWLAVKGYDVRLGARPMNRLIQDRLKKPLSEEILFGVLEKGGHVTAFLKKGEPAFRFEPATEGSKKHPPKKKKKAPAEPVES